MIGALLALCVSAFAAPVGWRIDGSGVVAGADPPTTWSPTGNVCWKAALPSWGNASPVVVGTKILVMSEPTTLTAHDTTDGHLLWRTSLDLTLAFEGAARADLVAKLEQADADEVALAGLRTEYARLQREVRRAGGDPGATAKLEALGKTMATLRARIEAVAVYRTSEDIQMIGYASPTPVTDGARVFALSGHGVLGAFDMNGKRLWTRWLGPPVRPMLGFAIGHAASPLLVDGLLIVPYGHLRGVDPATGRDVWVAEATWRHFGTPATMRLGGSSVLITPAGDVHRPRDGTVLARGLGAIINVGPVVSGDVVTLFGNQDADGRGALAAAWRLVAVGSGVRADKLWSKDLTDSGVIAGTPIAAGGLLIAVEAEGATWTIDARTGAVLDRGKVGDRKAKGIYPSPVLAGDKLYVFGHDARADVLKRQPNGTWRSIATNGIELSRASPWIAGKRIYARGDKTLWCFEAR